MPQDLALRPEIRIVSLSASMPELAAASERLTEAEKARSARFMRGVDRHRFVLGRHLLRSMLEELFGIDRQQAVLDIDQHGKPKLLYKPDVSFSISHSGDLVIVAAGTRMALGVDVERHRGKAQIEGVGRIVFAPCEQEALQACPENLRPAAFFRQWAMKEAVIKALGTGLLREPRRFAIKTAEGIPEVCFVGNGPDDVGRGWAIEDIGTPDGYSAAVAWRASSQIAGA